MSQYSAFGPFVVAWERAICGAIFDALLLDDLVDVPGDAPVIRVAARLALEHIAAPLGAEAFFFGRVRAFLVESGIVLADGVSRALISRDGSHIELELHADSMRPDAPFATHGAPGMLAIAARFAGVFHMHAAVVSWRDLPTLVVGQGHAGKTTTALSLIADGGEWAGDDLALFRPAAQGVECWGVARRFHLRPRTARLFPELAARGARSLVRDEVRVDVSLASVLPDRRVRGAVIPALVVMPEIVDRARSEAFAVDTSTALGSLLHASAMIVADELGRQQDQLSALGALVSHARPLALHLGRDGLRDPLAAAKAIGRLLDGES